MRLNIQHERHVHTTEPRFFISVFFLWKAIIIIGLDCIIVLCTSPLPMSIFFAVPLTGPSEVGFVHVTCFGQRNVSGRDKAETSNVLVPWVLLSSTSAITLRRAFSRWLWAWLLSLSSTMKTWRKDQSLTHSQIWE